MLTTLKSIDFPEIIIGLVAPLGTETGDSVESLRSQLESRGYEVHEIKLSKHFKGISKLLSIEKNLDYNSEFERIKKYIDFGNSMRAHFEDNAILALYACLQITVKRLINSKKDTPTDKEAAFSKKAYIINQFKREEEVAFMRSIYGPVFFQISIYSRRATRTSNFVERMRDSVAYFETGAETPRSLAEKLISTDEHQVDNEHGQRVDEVFHDADFIINADTNAKTNKEQVKRFVELLFSSNVISPTKMEYGLFLASSSALRSVDLSRQVGAAIFKPTGEILSMGSNEVPKAGGGTYWSDEQFDARDITLKQDPNHLHKSRILSEALSILDIDETTLTPEQKKKLRKSRLGSAIEYGRIVHAEMCAITDAARNGVPIKGSHLYCTTFPCHLCAKHIVAAGIEKVIFLEPYPKSLADDLHSDSIDVEGNGRGKYDKYPSVKFEHFFGVTPRRYRIFFRRKSRKQKGTGKLQTYVGGISKPIIDIKAPYYAETENTSLEKFAAATELSLEDWSETAEE